MSVATTDVFFFHDGMSLSISTTLTPCLIALSSAPETAGLVGVIAIPFTPCATMFWIAAISPASSVPLLPWAKITFAPGVAASHFFAAFSSVKKKSTGNFVMKPSFTVCSVLLGFAVALVARNAVAASTATKTALTTSLFLHIVRSFLRHTELTSAPGSALTSPLRPCSSGRGVGRVSPVELNAADVLESAHSPPPTISETICS